MKITLLKLRTLKVQADAILSQKALGFIADTKLSKLGRLAQQRIDYESGFDKINAEKGEIIKSIQKANEGVSDEKLNELVLSDEKFLKAIEAENKIWDQEVNDFEFTPIELVVDGDISAKFKDEVLPIEYRGRRHNISPYLSLHHLVDEGFIIVKEA